MARHSVSCGTLVVNPRRELLLCHVTNTPRWDIPKGLRDPGETELAAALRELREETGLVFDAALLRELGPFAYRRDKRLHLFMAEPGPALDSLAHLHCSTTFPHHVTDVPTPEMDGYRWAARPEVAGLCWPRMAEVLLSIPW
ncbi:NUDIX hydrolase [Massilia alkalitolerans]|uniref:NUDIX hydrolase n=1 Tax=Massilia alkalitolerans TaxID=286638 RepID=UPI0028AA5D65|nr:NUDIX domain-containing protein [Massilia alkalitolerans]